MTWRGRGCLEIGESSNPFFQPVSAEIGRTSRNSPTVDWTVTGSPKKVKPPYKVDGNFDFLYTRESDVIGSRVHKPQSLDLKMPTRTEFLKQRRLQAYEKMISSRGNSPDGNTGHRTQSPGSTQSFYEEDDDEDFNLTKARRFKMAAEDILSAYKHQPKNEDPRYTTTNNEYGKKMPSTATVVTERANRPQAFSKSFGGVKPKNTALTTSLTKSTVHKALDPQFV